MLLFCDSFSHYSTTELAKKWTSDASAAISLTAGPRGGSALDLTQANRRVRRAVTLPGGLSGLSSQFVIGAGVKVTRVDGDFHLMGVGLNATGAPQLSVRVNGDRSISVVRGGTILTGGGVKISDNSAVLLPVDEFYYVELAGTLHATLGSFSCYINGELVLEGNGLQTAPGASVLWDEVFLGVGGLGRAYVADYYVLDETNVHGVGNNVPLGPVRVDARFPQSGGEFPTGNNNGWHKSLPPNDNKLANNFQLVDDPIPDTSDYLFGSVGWLGSSNPETSTGVVKNYPDISFRQLFGFGAAPDPTVNVLGVQLCAYIAKSAAFVGNQAMDFLHRTTGIGQGQGNQISPISAGGWEQVVNSSAYTYLFIPIESLPFTSTPFTPANFQASEFGIRRGTTDSQGRIVDQQAVGVREYPDAAGGHAISAAAPIITGASVALGGFGGGGRITISGSDIPKPNGTTRKWRCYLRLSGGAGSPVGGATITDIPLVPDPLDAHAPGQDHASVDYLIPGGEFLFDGSMNDHLGTCRLAAMNTFGDFVTAPGMFNLQGETAGLAQFVAETIQSEPAYQTIVDTSSDFLGACAEPSTAVANRALGHLGINRQIESALLDQTAEAAAVRLYFQTTVDAVLRDFTWPFATAYAALELLAGTATVPVNGDWQYAYRVPDDMIAARRVLRAGQKRRPDPTPPQFRMGSDDDGELLYTDEVDAELEYTSRTVCPASRGDALFLVAIEWRLAHVLAPALAKDQKTVAFCWAMYRDALNRAGNVAANESEPDQAPVDPDWLRNR